MGFFYGFSQEILHCFPARVAELVDALDLKSSSH